MNEEEQTSDIATGSNGGMTKKEETNDRHEDHNDDVVTSARAGNTGHPPASPPPRPSGDVVARSRSSRDGHGAGQSGFSCDAESAFRIVDGLAPPPLSESLARLLCLGAFARSTPTTTSSSSTVRPTTTSPFSLLLLHPIFRCRFLFVTLWVGSSFTLPRLPTSSFVVVLRLSSALCCWDLA